MVAAELDRYLPFLATTKVLMAAVQRGVGREVAHEAIKEHAVAVALAMREAGGRGGEDLLDRLAADDRLGLDRADLDALLADRCPSPAPPATRWPASSTGSVGRGRPTGRRRYGPTPIL